MIPLSDLLPPGLLLLHSLDNSLKAKHILNPLLPYNPLYPQPYTLQQLRPLLLRPFHAGEEHHCDIEGDVQDRGITGREDLLKDEDTGLRVSEGGEQVGENFTGGAVGPVM